MTDDKKGLTNEELIKWLLGEEPTIQIGGKTLTRVVPPKEVIEIDEEGNIVEDE